MLIWLSHHQFQVRFSAYSPTSTPPIATHEPR